MKKKNDRAIVRYRHGVIRSAGDALNPMCPVVIEAPTPRQSNILRAAVSIYVCHMDPSYLRGAVTGNAQGFQRIDFLYTLHARTVIQVYLVSQIHITPSCRLSLAILRELTA
jgi:hypothetical protein